MDPKNKETYTVTERASFPAQRHNAQAPPYFKLSTYPFSYKKLPSHFNSMGRFKKLTKKISREPREERENAKNLACKFTIFNP